MASFESVKAITMIAGSDFTGDIYKLAEVSANDTIDVVNGLTDTVAGIIGEEVLAGRNVSLVLLQGRVKVMAGGNITAGQVLIPSVTGRVIGTTQGAIPTGVMGVGIALSAGVNGDIIEMLAQPVFNSV